MERQGKYDCWFGQEEFDQTRGEIQKIEEGKVCLCQDPDMLVCELHNKHFSFIPGGKEEIERKGFNFI